jgi:hypothetical protein
VFSRKYPPEDTGVDMGDIGNIKAFDIDGI